jgi:dolichol-phosphate mannosyltransferase
MAAPHVHILVVDDASPDGTGEIADALAREDDHVQVLHRRAKQGLGVAYLAGFGWGLKRGYDVLVQLDADGSHQPEELPRMLSALRHADLVVGSRWVPGGRTLNWPLARRLISQGGTLYARLALGIPIRDATGGYRAFRAGTLAGWNSTPSPRRATASRSTWPGGRCGTDGAWSRCLSRSWSGIRAAAR